MGQTLDMAAVTGAWEAMLRAPQRPSPGAWWAEREPALRRLYVAVGDPQAAMAVGWDDLLTRWQQWLAG